MLAKLKSLFSGDNTEQTTEILPELAAASLMLEVSWADHELSTEELSSVQRLLAELYGVDAAKAQLLIDDARERLQTNVGLHPYTSFLNEHLDEKGRFEVICALWELALADDHVDRFEEHTIRRVSDLLCLSHSRFIEAKLSAKSNRPST
jgi:uncharacterized tellurite resistance protein B-like protein